MDIFVPIPNSAVEPPNATMRLSQVAGLFRRNIALILLCAVLAAAAAFGLAMLSPSRYTAAATVAIDEQSFAIPELEGAVQSQSRQDPMPQVRTEVQALLSRQLIQSVIDKLGVARLPEFNPALRPPTQLHRLRQRIEQALPVLAAPSAPTDGTEAVQTEVSRALVVSQDNRSLVIGVAFTSESPDLAARFVNTLIESYLAVRSQRRATTNQGANVEILQRVSEVRAGLSSLEQRMHDLRTKGELVSLRAGSIGQQQVEELATAAARASLVRAQLEAQFQPGSAAVVTARTREASAQRQLQQAREASVKAENAQAELNDVQQEVNLQRTLYQSLLQGMQRTAAQSTTAGLLPDMRVLSSAVPPSLPSSPNTKLAAALGGGGGFVIGLLVALTRARASETVANADDVARLGLSAVQLVAGRRGRRTLLARVRQNPQGYEAEALRLLRARLQGEDHLGAPRSVLFVSPDDDDAACVAAAFAYVMAGAGDKVVLAEGNLRQPRIAQLLGVAQAGLLGVLEEERDWREMLLHDPSVKLDLLVTRRAASAATPLEGARFQNLLEDLRQAYHLTVLNGPSATSSDTLALAAEANATVLVLRAAGATSAVVQEVAARLASASRSRVTVALLTS